MSKKTAFSVFLFISIIAIPVFFNSCQSAMPEGYQTESGQNSCPLVATKSLNNQFHAQTTLKPTFVANGFNKMGFQTSFKAANNDNLIATIDNTCLAIEMQQKKQHPLAAIINLAHLNSSLKRQTYHITKPENLQLKIFSETGCLVGFSENKTYKPFALSDTYNDTQVNLQVHLESIKADKSFLSYYDKQRGIQNLPESESVVIAVIDTGINSSHPDLQGILWSGQNGYGVDATTLGTNTTVSYDVSDISPKQHGTHVSALIAAKTNNNFGLAGVMASRVKIMPIKAFYKPDPNDDVILSSSSIISKAIYWAIQNKADVINLSLGGTGDDPAVKQALVDAIGAGIFVVTAAGNGNANSPAQELTESFFLFPASYGGTLEGLITVGSINVQDGIKSSFSHWSTTHVEMSAPGAENETRGLLSAARENNYRYLQGTSQAAPLVAGAAGLVIGLIKQNYSNKQPTPQKLEALLKDGAKKDPFLSYYFKDGNTLDLENLYSHISAEFPAIKGATDNRYVNCK